MKVIFLDVDGVLNAFGVFSRDPLELGKEQVRLLRKAVLDSDARICVSSTWRKHDNHLMRLFEQLGMDMKRRWIGETPVLESQRASGMWTSPARGEEIKAWLDEHKEVSCFAIVDDNSDMGELSDRLVLTNGLTGMQQQDADKFVALLNG